jgi:hypothetical protein
MKAPMARGSILPWYMAIIALAGLPGTRRGRKKLNVMAENSVTTNTKAR